MRRLTFLSLTLFLGIALLAACQRNAPAKPSSPPTDYGLTQATGASLSPTPTEATTATPTPTSTPMLTPTLTPTPSAQPPTETPTPVASDRLAAAQRAFAWGDYPRARDEFAALLADPGADQAERQLAAYWVGRSALEAGDYETALRALQGFVKSYPAASQVPSAHFLMAQAYEGLGNWRGAIAAYETYLETDDTLAIYAYQAIGDAAMLALDYDRAAEAYADGLRSAPDASWTVHMRESIAQAELARGDPAAAIKQYDAILSTARIRAYRARKSST